MKRENLHLLLTPSTAAWVCGHPTGHPCAITEYLVFRTTRHMTAGSCSHSAPTALVRSNTVSCPVHPEGAGWGWGQHPAPASQVLRHQSGKNVFVFFFQKALCVELSHVGTAKGQTQTVAMQSMIPWCVISLRSPFSGTMKVCGHIVHVLCHNIQIYLDFVTSSTVTENKKNFFKNP